MQITAFECIHNLKNKYCLVVSYCLSWLVQCPGDAYISYFSTNSFLVHDGFRNGLGVFVLLKVSYLLRSVDLHPCIIFFE